MRIYNFLNLPALVFTELYLNLAFTLNVSECLNRERCLIVLTYIVYKCNNFFY